MLWVGDYNSFPYLYQNIIFSNACTRPTVLSNLPKCFSHNPILFMSENMLQTVEGSARMIREAYLRRKCEAVNQDRSALIYGLHNQNERHRIQSNLSFHSCGYWWTWTGGLCQFWIFVLLHWHLNRFHGGDKRVQLSKLRLIFQPVHFGFEVFPGHATTKNECFGLASKLKGV